VLKPSGIVVLESVLKDCVLKDMLCPITGKKLKGKETAATTRHPTLNDGEPLSVVLPPGCATLTLDMAHRTEEQVYWLRRVHVKPACGSQHSGSTLCTSLGSRVKGARSCVAGIAWGSAATCATSKTTN